MEEDDDASSAAARWQCYGRLEDFESFHRKIFYSTRTADDKVQYLSILICAEPHIREDGADELNHQQRNENDVAGAAGKDLSDAIISDEDV